MNLPKPGNILEGDFWAEPVRVLTVHRLGVRTKIEAVGTRTQQFYSRIFGDADLARIRVRTDSERDFSGRGKNFSLAMEAHQVRFAQQFDPLVAVNTSQVDSLPHQIEAVPNEEAVFIAPVIPSCRQSLSNCSPTARRL